MSDKEKGESYFGRTDISEEEKKAAQSLGGQKSGQTRRNKAEIKKMLNNMSEVRNDAIADFVQDNPSAFNMMYAEIFKQAMSGERWATELIINSTGLAAPKQTEVKDTTEVNPMEAKEKLKELIEKKQGKVVDMNGKTK